MRKSLAMEAGIIDRIEERKNKRRNTKVLCIQDPWAGCLLMIPIENSEEIGVRPIIKPDEADMLMEALSDIKIDMTKKLEQAIQREYAQNKKRRPDGGCACGKRAYGPENNDKGFPRGEKDAPLRQSRY